MDSWDENGDLVTHRIDLDKTNLSHIEYRRTDLYRNCLKGRFTWKGP